MFASPAAIGPDAIFLNSNGVSIFINFNGVVTKTAVYIVDQTVLSVTVIPAAPAAGVGLNRNKKLIIF